MNNTFIVRNLDWQSIPLSKRIIGAIAGKLGLNVPLSQPKYAGMMSTLEKRMNMSLLIDQVFAYAVQGDIVEVGCHDGKSACLFQTYNRNHQYAKTLHVYDSFEGLPEPTTQDGDLPERYGAGKLATTRFELAKNFRALQLRSPYIHQGWFEDTLPTTLPEQIAFAHLDSDYYASIMCSLKNVYPRLTRGAVCLIDDYSDHGSIHKTAHHFPGVKQACNEFFADKPESVSLLYAGYYSHAYMRKT